MTIAHGMGIVPGAATPDTSLSIRERIVAHIVTALESIKGAPIASRSSATRAGSGTAAGTYTGIVTRRYQIECTLAGESGTAEVTITDVTPAAQQAIWDAGESTDDGAADLVVTSGVAFAVGSLGVTLAITFDSLSLGDTWFVDVGNYRTSVERVVQSDDQREYTGNWIRMPLESEDAGEGPVIKETREMLLELELYSRRSEDSDGEIRKLIHDAKRALWRDPTRGQIALDTEFVGNDGFALQATKAGSLAVLRVIVTYRTSRADTRVL